MRGCRLVRACLAATGLSTLAALDLLLCVLYITATLLPCDVLLALVQYTVLLLTSINQWKHATYLRFILFAISVDVTRFIVLLGNITRPVS